MKTILEVGAAVCSAQEVYNEPVRIVIEDGIIQAVTPLAQVGVSADRARTDSWRGEAGVQYIRRPRTVAIPGLVNTHGHAAMTLLRGAGDDLPLMRWLEEKVYPMEAKLTRQAIYWGTQLACWEMIRSGTTCYTDMYFQMHDAAQAVLESGMRGVLCWGVVGLDDSGRAAGVANSRSFVNQWKGASSRLLVTLGPHAPYTCPPDYLREIADLAGELGVPLQIHLSETRGEVEQSLQTYGKTPIAQVEACGLLEHPVLAAHCVHVNEDDMDVLAARRVHVAHNPQSNLKLGSGVAPVARMLEKGIVVGLGTDGAASNNNLDMFEEMRLAATLHKGVTMDATAVPAPTAFRMATEEGAKCAFLPAGHGTLTSGAWADITLLDLDSPHFVPIHDLLSNVVYAAGADDVTDVFVAGRQLLSNRESLTLDVERIRYEARSLEAHLKAQ
ncbi:amidohydrolase [Alicyclobacillus shizuokensis]|uniref:amidohydrolase n=1 Tax=Alicyclobacillus shizuokensis TaxID=392014 RepID=UPI0008298555|nr:amidohydrolase [Alicyclobacillus shizuokensis]MCL6625422.1 amidohydrolase [Alicyclobacillus shizuokensis]